MSERQALGRQGEDLAVRYLVEHGYTLIARNWRTRAGEIDIVARQGEWLVFVEVRTRRRRQSGQVFGSPEESVDARKQARLAALVDSYLSREPWAGPCRVDVIALELLPDGSIARLRHLEDAVGGNIGA